MSAAGAWIFGAWLFYQIALGQPNYLGGGFSRTLSLHVAYGGLFVLYGAMLARQRRLPSGLPLDGAVLLMLAALAIAALAAVNRTVSIESAVLSAAPILALYAVHDFRILTADRLIRTIIGVVLLVALIGLLEEATRYSRWLQLASAVDGGFDRSHLMPPSLPRSGGLMHVNEQALVLNLGMPFALLLALRPRAGIDRWLGIAAAGLILPALIVTMTRGGWIAFAAAVPCFAVLYVLSSHASMLDAIKRLPVAKLAVAGAMAAMLFIAGAVFAWDARPQWLFRDTLSYRQEAAAKAIDIFADRPLTGSGPNSYGLLYDTYGGVNISYNVHPHNAYLSVLVDSGLAGAALVLAAVGIAVAWFVRAFLRSGGESRRVLAACFGALATLPVHGLVHSPQLFNPVLLLVALIAVIAVRVAAPEPARPVLSPIRRSPRLAVAGLIPLIMAGWLFFDMPHSRYDTSVHFLAAGKLDEASEAASEAAGSTPASAAYQLNAGVIEVLLYYEDGSRDRLARAVSYLQAALEADPYSSLARANLSQTLLALGDSEGAVEQAEAAMQHAPYDAEIASIAGMVYEAAGLKNRAIEAYAQAVRLQPVFAQAPYWSTTPERAAMRAAVIEASAAPACSLGEAAVLQGAYADDLAVLLDRCREQGVPSEIAGSPGDSLVIMLYALGLHDELRTEAARLQAVLPGSSAARVGLGLSAAADGDLRGARHEFMLAGYAGNLDARLFLGVTYVSQSGWNDISPVLRLPADATPMPAAVKRLVARAESPAAGFANSASYRAAANYFRIDLMREAPSVILLPGEWQELTSPREYRFADALVLR